MLYYIGITVGFSVPHSVVNETQGDVEICIDIIIGALERNISVYLQAIPITGRRIHLLMQNLFCSH